MARRMAKLLPVRLTMLAPLGFGISGLCGLLLLALGGAPLGWLMVQGGALLLGLIVLTRPLLPVIQGFGRALPLLVPLAMLATVLVDPGLDGVHRWLTLGPVRLHIGLLLLPSLLIVHLAYPSRAALVALLAATLMLALQPDFGTALALALGLVPAALLRGTWSDRLALGAAWAAVGASALRPDTLLPVPLVEGVLMASWDWHWLAGPLSVAGATALPLLLMKLAAANRAVQRAALSLAALWFGLLLASLVGAYPVPMLGYGASAVLGLALAVGLMAPFADSRTG